MLLPAVALAQPKKPGGKGGGKPPAQQPAAAPAGGAAAGGSGEIELDEPSAQPAQPGGEQPAAAGEAPAGAPTGGICEIDPSACPKAEDVKAAAGKKINAEIYAVEQIYALRYHRFELQPYWSFSLNDQFVSHPGPGLNANFYITNVLAVGISGTYYGGLNVDSDFNFENRRAARIGVPINEYLLNANVNFTYVPVYGKFAGFGQFIFQYDAYVVGGVGGLWDRPIPVIDPDNRNFKYQLNLNFDVGLGLRIFLTRWLAATVEVRDYIFNEHLENLQVAATQAQQQDPGTWYGEHRFTNAVQAQLGVSVFLPFSWEYRLPK
jgi:outer membrane beta-barrel protein